MVIKLALQCTTLFFCWLFISMLEASDNFEVSVNQQAAFERFNFQYQGLTYQGVIQYPQKTTKGVVVIIPGHGKTNFVQGSQLADIREFLRQQGLTVVAWDKAGTGQSEGEYNHDQTVYSSSEEALAAIKKIRQLNIEGAENIGLWTLSRGGWIGPLVIAKDKFIKFWISVSGTDQFGSFRYLLKENFKLEGRTPEQVNRLMAEYDYGWRALRGSVDYKTFLQKTDYLAQDPFFKRMNIGTPSEQQFLDIQAYFKSQQDIFDEITGQEIIIPDFEKMLSSFDIPTLAVFGELDSQVDWRSTKTLYESTIGENDRLSITVLPECNHLMFKSRTGAYFEDLKPFNWQRCKGFFDAMSSWLMRFSLVKATQSD